MKDITKMLVKEMVPALGCTGPTAYALAAARCKPLLTAEPKLMKIYVSPAFLKIGFGVATPGTSEPGIGIAAAMGLFGGNYELGLSVLKTTTRNDIVKAHQMVADGKVQILCAWEQTGVYVRAEVITENETAVSVVAGTHDGIVSVMKNGKELYHADMQTSVVQLNEEGLNPNEIFRYIENVEPEELRFLLQGYHMNLALAEDGLKQKFGLESGRAYLASQFREKEMPADLYIRPFQYLPASLSDKIKILVSAASDARMGGSLYPAMAAMGDGNQGITTMLPVGITADHLGMSEEKIIRALALSCLLTFYVKMHIGRASAFCLCGIASAAGAAGGISYLKRMDEDKIRASVKNAISPLAGMLCDGAKNACALKMAIACSTVITAVELAEAGIQVGYYDGLASDSLEDTVSCITHIATDSQEHLDTSMVRSILEKEEKRRLQL